MKKKHEKKKIYVKYKFSETTLLQT